MIRERDIENLLEQALVRKGWVVEAGNPGRNVYAQRPRSETEVKKLGGLAPDFCLYISAKSSAPEVIVETKKPGMNLARAKEQVMHYARLLGSKIVVLFDGRTTKHYWVDTGETLTCNGVEVTSFGTADFYGLFVASGSAQWNRSPLAIKTREELIGVFAYANQKLRKAGITKGMERFFEFSNLLFLKLVSEENDVVASSIPSHIKWEAYRNKQGEELLSYINGVVIPELERVFNRSGEQTLFSPLAIRDTVALKSIIDKLDALNLSGIETDIKGDAFEYFIQQYNSTNNDLGEYFTPRHIVNFLVRLADPKYGERVYDPFCGTGGMLIAAFNYVKASMQEQGYLTDQVLQDLKEHCVFGGEISSNARIAKMNMILTGDGHSNIAKHDSLRNPVKGLYDVVITNIPFNLEGTATECYSLLSRNGNVQSIQHIIDSLNDKPTARALVIVPEAVLNNAEIRVLREYLLDNNLLTQVISLPSGVFLPYTEAKASVLVLQGYNGRPVDRVRYTIIKNDGYTLTQRRRRMEQTVNDLDEYLYDRSYATREISVADIRQDSNRSLVWFKYFNEVPEDYVLLKDILEEERVANSALYETATVTKHDFFGILRGEDYWGDSFVSVTSEANDDYKVVGVKSLAYNPSRANTGSLCINLTGRPLAVSKMYVTFRVSDERFLPEYVFLCLKSREGLRAIVDRSFGSVRQTLRFADLCTIAIPVIPLEEQRRIVDDTVKLYYKVNKLQAQLNGTDVNSMISAK